MEAGETRLSTGRRYHWKEEGHFLVPGQQREGNRNSDVISKREKGGTQRVSLALSFSVNWSRSCLLRVERQVWDHGIRREEEPP